MHGQQNIRKNWIILYRGRSKKL